MANFYGVTPPRSTHQAPPPKVLANFYGVTPPDTGYNSLGIDNQISQGYVSNIHQQANIKDKNLANFYGVTPPPTGKQGGNNDFSKNMSKFFGCDVVDPEFQYAADIINKKTPINYQQAVEKPYGMPPSRNDRPAYISTAKRIFN